jgi:inhibitor of cysteine peptidase
MRFSRRALPALIAALLLVPAGSAAQAKSTPKEVKVTKKANGSTVHLHKGDLLRVTLAENPSTGYGWTLATKPKASILGLRANHFKQGPQDPNGPSVGVPGTRIFKWRALKAGTTKLKIGNYPPGSKKAANFYRLKVEVG